jgi:hypothetical protein
MERRSAHSECPRAPNTLSRALLLMLGVGMRDIVCLRAGAYVDGPRPLGVGVEWDSGVHEGSSVLVLAHRPHPARPPPHSPRAPLPHHPPSHVDVRYQPATRTYRLTASINSDTDFSSLRAMVSARLYVDPAFVMPGAARVADPGPEYPAAAPGSAQHVAQQLHRSSAAGSRDGSAQGGKAGAAVRRGGVGVSQPWWGTWGIPCCDGRCCQPLS